MKFRDDFVTNSSSSSFLICKKFLNEEQIDAIRNYRELARRLEMDYWDSWWDIEENEMFITGSTCIDNFSMGEFFTIIGIPDKVVTWGENRFSIPEDIENAQEPSQKKEWQIHLENIKNEIPCKTSEDEEFERLMRKLEDNNED